MDEAFNSSATHLIRLGTRRVWLRAYRRCQRLKTVNRDSRAEKLSGGRGISLLSKNSMLGELQTWKNLLPTVCSHLGTEFTFMQLRRIDNLPAACWPSRTQGFHLERARGHSPFSRKDL